MNKTIATCLSTVFLAAPAVLAQDKAPAQSTLRPPAVPLVANDPFLSIWSMSNELTETPTRHWTGKPHTLRSLVRIDDKTNAELLERFNANVASGFALFDDRNGDRNLDPEERATAIAVRR